MHREIFIISLFCVVLGVSYDHGIDLKPCREHDDVCVTENSRKIFYKVVNGLPEIGIKSADPMKQKYVEGNLAIVKYTLTNSTLTGFKNCDIARASINFKTSVLRYELSCPLFIMVGDYEVDGTLIVVPIKGSGDYRIEVKDYNVMVDIDYKVINDKYGNRQIKFKSFRADGDLQGGMIFDLRNLFNGQKELGDIVLKFANKNWKPVSKELQGPVFNANIKTLLKGYNKLLKYIPTDQLFMKTT